MTIQIKISDLTEFCQSQPASGKRLYRRDEYFKAMLICQPEFDAAGITERSSRLVDFMAQVGHESGMFTIDEESLYYTTTGALKRAWPTRFRTTGQALPFLRRPQALANKVYGGRMGNQHVRGGGWKYRGRGALQTTGFYGYRARSQSLDESRILTAPDIVADTKAVGIRCAIDEWTKINGNKYSDANMFRQLTRKINGGYNGLSDRYKKRKLANAIWGGLATVETTITEGAISSIQGAPRNVDKRPDILEPGDQGEQVKALQRRLVDLGYPVGDIDGKFGDLTADAVVLYKQHHDLNKDGLDADEVDVALSKLIDSPDAPRRAEYARSNETAQDLANRGSRSISLLLWVRKIALGLFGGTALGLAGEHASADVTGQTAFEALSAMKNAIQPITGLFRWVTSEPLVLYCCFGFAIFWGASRLLAWRVSDHRTGKNKGR